MFLQKLGRACAHFGCLVHAYALMPNHIHLLVTPTQDRALSRMMQALGSGYVLYFNAAHSSTGSLWEGRFRSSVIKSDFYLLACYRYIELNPVRAGIVSMPEKHRWSSYRHNALGHEDAIITPHPTYLGLGPDDCERAASYKRIVTSALPETSIERIRVSTHSGRELN